MPVKINYRKCNACKACYSYCPSDLFGWDEERDIPYIAYPDECWYCGICKMECKQNAIELTLPPQCWLEINKGFISKLNAPTELQWPEQGQA